MSKRTETPTIPTQTGLLLAGEAKVETNASGGDQKEEIFPLEPYDPA